MNTYRPPNGTGVAPRHSGGRTFPERKHFVEFFRDRGWAMANGWVLMSKSFRQQQRFYPNLVFCHIGLREVLVPLRIKGAPEHAATISAPLIEHYCRRVQDTQDGRIEPTDPGVSQVWVAFARLDGTYLGTTTIREVAKAIIDADAEPNAPNDPALAPYYWVDENARISTLDMFLDRVRGDDFVF